MDDSDGTGAPKSSWDDSTKTTFGVLVALVVVLIVAGIGVVTVRDANETLQKVISTTTTTVPGAAGATGQTTTTAPASDLSPEQARVFEEVRAQVAAIRGLAWQKPVPVRFLTRAQLSARVRQLNAEDLAENRDEFAADEAILKLLKLIGKDVNFAKAFDDVLAGGVLGYYDDETKEMFVGGTGTDTLDPATRSVLAHELTHALADQHFDIEAKAKALDDANRTEELFAFTALVEGEANLVEGLWQQRHLSDSERRQALLGGAADGGAYDKAPPYLLESLRFPYEEGLNFVRTLHRAGGFGAVDDAYRRPPTSTEHILHPSTYVSGQGWTAPPLPDLAVATGCGKVDTGTLGEFDLGQLLGQHLSTTDARVAASGWNGDSFGVVRCGTALGLADRWQTDDPAEATRLADALVRWARGWSGSSRAPDAEGRFTGPSGSGRIVRAPGRVDLVLADDVPTVDRLVRAISAG